MKIGITCYPTYGGSGVVATELGIELAARGHEVHFISYAMPIRLNQSSERIFFHEVEVTTYPLFDHPPYTLALAVKMFEVAEESKLDVLHVHYAIPHSVSALLARSMAAPRRLPFITTLHGTDITLVGSDRSYLPDHAFFHRAERRRDRDFQLPERTHRSRIRNSPPDRNDPELRQLRSLLRAKILLCARNGPTTASQS